jgi:hypothetical protein
MRTRKFIRIEGGLAHYVEERILKTISQEDLGKVLEHHEHKTELMPFGTIAYNAWENNKTYTILREPTLLHTRFVSVDRTWQILLPIQVYHVELRNGELYTIRTFFMVAWPLTGTETLFHVPFPNRYMDNENKNDGCLCREGLFVPPKSEPMIKRLDTLIEQVLATEHNLELIEDAIKSMPSRFRDDELPDEFSDSVCSEIFRESLDEWEQWTMDVYDGATPDKPPDVLAACTKIDWRPYGAISRLL